MERDNCFDLALQYSLCSPAKTQRQCTSTCFCFVSCGSRCAHPGRDFRGSGWGIRNHQEWRVRRHQRKHTSVFTLIISIKRLKSEDDYKPIPEDALKNSNNNTLKIFNSIQSSQAFYRKPSFKQQLGRANMEFHTSRDSRTVKILPVPCERRGEVQVFLISKHFTASSDHLKHTRQTVHSSYF